MAPRSSFARCTATITLALQLLVGGAGPLADAWLEAKADRLAIHIESQQAHPCDHGHDHSSCGLCQVVGLSGALAARAFPIAPPPVQTSTPVVPSRVVPSAIRIVYGSRAPPLA